jgi:hypothetical protein
LKKATDPTIEKAKNIGPGELVEWKKPNLMLHLRASVGTKPFRP